MDKYYKLKTMDIGQWTPLTASPFPLPLSVSLLLCLFVSLSPLFLNGCQYIECLWGGRGCCREVGLSKDEFCISQHDIDTAFKGKIKNILITRTKGSCILGILVGVEGIDFEDKP